MRGLSNAIVTPTILEWARMRLHRTYQESAKKAGVEPSAVASWEKGQTQPTIRQARLLADFYKIPFAAFYLSAPPDSPINMPHDYRRVALSTPLYDSYELLNAIQDAWRSREYFIEIYSKRNQPIRQIRRTINITDNPETVGVQLRRYLSVTIDEQYSWRDKRVAFNNWRYAVEQLGILVLQISGIEVPLFRGFSLVDRPLPVIAINRSDGYAARSFTLIHELCHVLIRVGGMCDLYPSADMSSTDRRLEVYCNAVSASCLMPEQYFYQHPFLQQAKGIDDWSDNEIFNLSKHFSVSRESIVRRLLSFGKVSNMFYEQKRQQYIEEAKSYVRPPGFVSPATNAISILGKPYVNLVLSAYRDKAITASDASDYLGLRIKHFGKLSQSLGEQWID